MGNHKISDDLKEASLRMKLYPDEEVLAIVGFSRSTLKRAAHRKALTGSVAKKGRGRPRILALSDCQYLLKLARFKPTLFLDEYARRLEDAGS
jgi:transposase